MLKIFILLTVFGLTACTKHIGNYFPPDEPSFVDDLGSKRALKKEFQMPESPSQLLQAILEVPEVARSFEAAKVAQSKIAIVKTARNTKIDASGSAGLAGEYKSTANGLANINLKSSRLFSDYGLTDRTILSSEISAQVSLLETQIQVDNTLQTLMRSYGERKIAKETIKIIDHYIGIYNSSEDKVKIAVEAGVLSNSDYLELRSLKNENLLTKAQNSLNLHKSESYLKISLGSKYKLALRDMTKRHQPLRLPTSKETITLKQKIINLTISKIILDIETQKSSNKPSSKLEASINSSQSNEADVQVFAGLTFAFPVKDGGKAKAQISVLSKELEVKKLEQKILNEKILVATHNWTAFNEFYNIEKKLLLEQKLISEERINELGQRLNTGRTDISGLAKEILSSIKTDIAIEKLEFTHLSNILNLASATSQTCQLLNLCRLIQNAMEFSRNSQLVSTTIKNVPESKELQKNISRKYLVQLGAYRKESSAKSEMQRINRLFKKYFDNKIINFKISKSNKNGFYRLRLIGFLDKKSANNLCNKLKKSNNDCLILLEN
tara:strand:+ start:4006 stop:5667 length:1662 start_codon:yes stop_codon:yes gene_type:complete